MSQFVELLPLLAAMAVLIVCSGFFSSSEAALFYLRVTERRALADGGLERGVGREVGQEVDAMGHALDRIRELPLVPLAELLDLPPRLRAATYRKPGMWPYGSGSGHGQGAGNRR